MKPKITSIILALIFLASGGAKLAGLPFELAAFERWGYPLWFMYATGIIEVLGGIALLFSRVSALAALGLGGMMIGAVGTHAVNHEWPMLLIAAAIMALAFWRAYVGKGDILALLKR